MLGNSNAQFKVALSDKPYNKEHYWEVVKGMGSRFEIVKSTDAFIFGGYASAVKDGVGDFTVD